MILVDANVLMYASGAAHPNKKPAVAFLNRVAREEVQAAIRCRGTAGDYSSIQFFAPLD
jgi:hypothetical protein